MHAEANSGKLQNVYEAVTSRSTDVVGGFLVAVALYGNVSENAHAAPRQPLIEAKNMQPCKGGRGVVFGLHGSDVIERGRLARFQMQIRACDNEGVDKLRGVKIRLYRPYAKKSGWKIAADDEVIEKSFSIVPPRNESVSTDDNPKNQLVIARAFKKGKKIGAAKWQISYKPRDVNTPPQWLIDPTPDNECTPDPDFVVGFQDDGAVVQKKNASPEEAFLKAKSFGATAVRINVIYGHYMAYGYRQYVDAVDTAIRLGFTPQVTIMQTPRYLSFLDQAVSWESFSPEKTQEFASEVARIFGSKVNRYSIYNEVNHDAFSNNQSMSEYSAAYLAGRLGVKSVNPSAQVLAGELAAGHGTEWIKNFNKLGVDGIALHPYGNGISHMREYVKTAKSPVYASEYGNFRSNPLQGQINRAAIREVRCSGAKQIIMYQMISDPNAEWDTSPNGS
jgi:hypothetical protein